MPGLLGTGAPDRGTLEIVTGGGKTLIALACAARAAAQRANLRLAVVVPTEALARQWREVIISHTTLNNDEVGLLGSGGNDSLSTKRALVCVLNSAAKRLPDDARNGQPLMLVIDECHRAGAQPSAASWILHANTASAFQQLLTARNLTKTASP